MNQQLLNKQILYYAVKYQGEYLKMKQAIQNEESYEMIEYDGSYITILDDQYPKSLLRLNDPPYILFYEGNIALLKYLNVAVVGSRVASDYGVKMCKWLVNRLKKKYCICSGMALGIDSIAHCEALSHQSIAVLGCGIDICYPKSNYSLYQILKQDHLIISEYPNGVAPLKHHFPKRNRIIAALSKALIVCEANKKSGTMITVNEALNMQIPIYAIPHNIDQNHGKGCNLLIQQGANMIIDEYDIDTI